MKQFSSEIGAEIKEKLVSRGWNPYLCETKKDNGNLVELVKSSEILVERGPVVQIEQDKNYMIFPRCEIPNDFSAVFISFSNTSAIPSLSFSSQTLVIKDKGDSFVLKRATPLLFGAFVPSREYVELLGIDVTSWHYDVFLEGLNGLPDITEGFDDLLDDMQKKMIKGLRIDQKDKCEFLDRKGDSFYFCKKWLPLIHTRENIIERNVAMAHIQRYCTGRFERCVEYRKLDLY